MENKNQITLHKEFFNSDAVQKNLNQILDSPKKVKSFTTALMQIISGTDLKNADPKTVYASAVTAAVLDLEPNPIFGRCYFLPFKNKQGTVNVQFILGYKGLIELAIRSNKYEQINTVAIYENQFIEWNFLTETLQAKSIEGKGEVVGYYAMFKTKEGFTKADFWSKEKVEKHAIRHSKQQFQGKLSGVWKTDFDSMACKTVLRSILSKYGILSTQLQEAITSEVETAPNNEFQEVEVIDVTETSEVDFLKNKINLCENASDLAGLKLEVCENREIELITAYNLKCASLEVEKEYYVEI